MDDSSADWFSQLLNSPDQSLQDVDELDFNLFSPEIYNSSSSSSSSVEMEIAPTETCLTNIEISAEHQQQQQQLITNHENATPNSTASFSYVNSSGQSEKSKDLEMVVTRECVNYSPSSSNENLSGLKSRKKTKSVQATSREPEEARNHVVAERRRRERLNQKLISLSSLIPGLKKMDKATIIGDATKYIKQLQEHVQTLEGKINTKIVEPPTAPSSLNGSGVASDEYNSSADEYFDNNYSKQPFPEIEVKVSDKNVLIRIHCQKQGGVTAKVLTELHNLDHLKVINCSAMSFGNTALDITIIAKIDDEFLTKKEDLLKILGSAVLKDNATDAIKFS